jgi:hypothetical protein
MLPRIQKPPQLDPTMPLHLTYKDHEVQFGTASWLVFPDYLLASL